LPTAYLLSFFTSSYH